MEVVKGRRRRFRKVGIAVKAMRVVSDRRMRVRGESSRFDGGSKKKGLGKRERKSKYMVNVVGLQRCSSSNSRFRMMSSLVLE